MVESKLYRSSLEGLYNSVEVDDKTFLITGASGLIGSCLVDLLMSANTSGKHNRVYALGRSEERLLKRFSPFIASEGFHIIEQDICVPLDDKYDFDYIIHCASNADPRLYVKYPVETMVTNLKGGINVLEYVRKHKECKAEILSTFEVYGDTVKDDYCESETGLLNYYDIRSCYPESKRAIETLALCYCKEYGVNVNIGRLCSIYGPTMLPDDSKAHAQFLKNAVKGKDVVLKSKGTTIRSYCYVLDAVSAILSILFHGSSPDVYNISNENSVATIAQMADIVAELSGRAVATDLAENALDGNKYNPRNSILNNDKLKGLGWTGHYDLKTGVSECLSILREIQTDNEE